MAQPTKKYEVIKDFKDLEDNDHIYREGKPYPHKGRPKKARVEQLITANNKIGEPVIREVVEADDAGGDTEADE